MVNRPEQVKRERLELEGLRFGFEDSDAESLFLLNSVIRVETYHRGQYLDIEPDLRHAPLIIIGPGCNAKTQSANTP